MEAVSLISTEVGGKPGGNNNPDGLGGKSGKHIDNLSITKVVNVKSERVSYGDTTDYTVRRLAKQRPDIHAKVVAGELLPNAAAIEAGFRKTKFQLPTDPSAAGRYLAQRVDHEWFIQCMDAFMKAISQ